MTQSYLSHFGLHAEPFSNAPVTRFYYESDQHRQALTRLGYALSAMRGLAVVIGDIGTGKTTLARRLLDALPEQEFEAALLVIIHSGVDANWLLKRIAMQLGVTDPADEKLALLSQLYQRLVQIYESGKKAVVLIDEAQMLATRELMEEFRGLLNLEVPERKLLSLVFFGLPEIDRILKLDPPLRQRVALRFRLQGLSREATEQYITHRMTLAGAKQPIFTTDGLDTIYMASGGTPRLINTLCDNALLEGALAGERRLSAAIVSEVVDNLGLDPEYSVTYPELTADADPPVQHAPSAAPAPQASSIAVSHPIAPKPSATPAQPVARPVSAPAPRPSSTLTPRPAVTPATPARPSTPTSAAKPVEKKQVNLDEIDSLLASIRKP